MAAKEIDGVLEVTTKAWDKVVAAFSLADNVITVNEYRAFYSDNGTGGLRFAFPKLDDSGSNLNKPISIGLWNATENKIIHTEE